jgi:hypothetical protein
VLINPAVDPLKTWKARRRDHAWHSDEPFEFKREYIDELAALKVARITRPERYFLLAATGDEVLDYRDMVAHYAGARQHVIEGSDHAISEFAAVCRRGAGILRRLIHWIGREGRIGPASEAGVAAPGPLAGASGTACRRPPPCATG